TSLLSPSTFLSCRLRSCFFLFLSFSMLPPPPSSPLFPYTTLFRSCIGAISKEDYGAVIDGVIGFLSGDTQTIQAELTERMREAAADERFEEAARYRNRLFSIRHLADRQAADRRDVGSVDVIGLAIDGEQASVQ